MSETERKKKKNSEKIIAEDDKLAIAVAIERIRHYHEKQIPKDMFWTDKIGVKLGWNWKPIERVGVYVPGGTASYPSSVIMNIIPAKVAGVEDVILCSPTPNGNYNPLVLYAAKRLGVKNIFRVGSIIKGMICVF